MHSQKTAKSKSKADDCDTECSLVVDPVCGTDGMTHESECNLQKMVCLTKTSIKVAHDGPCKGDEHKYSEECPKGDCGNESEES